MLTGRSFNNNHKVEEDFVMAVVHTDKQDIEREFHLQAFPKPQVLTRSTIKGGILQPTQRKRMNVMMLMIDSISHAQFQRKAGKVYRYIKEKLGSIVLDGHTIVGESRTVLSLFNIVTIIAHVSSVERFLRFQTRLCAAAFSTSALHLSVILRQVSWGQPLFLLTSWQRFGLYMYSPV